MLKKSDMFLAMLSGILLVLGFPLFDLYPVTWLALVPLLISLRDKNPKPSFLLGLITGVIYFAGTLYWVYHSMYHYGNVPLVFSILLLIVLSLIMAVYTGTFSMLFNFLTRHRSIPAFFAVPVLWVTLEYLRTYALTGYPWSSIGYSQYKFLPIIQISDMTGIYGVSFLITAVNGAIFDIADYKMKRPDNRPVSLLKPLSGVIVIVLLFSAALLYGLDKLEVKSSGSKINVSIVQGNIEQDKKWDPKFQRHAIDTYKRLTDQTLSGNPDLIVWPEAALPFVFGYHKKMTEEITAYQKQNGKHLIFGSVLVNKVISDNLILSNSSVMLSPEGSIISVYDKIHLVPFGEYVPLGKYFPFIKKMVTAIGGFVQGTEPTVMETPFASIGNLICYEIIFPGLVRQFIENGANMLVTISNDAWFGNTAAPYQFFSMAVFRAVENRVPVVRAANTGISGFIDSRGRIINQSGIFVESTLTEKISVGTEKSFYSKHGDIFAYFCIFSCLILIIGNIIYEKKKL